MMVVLCLKRKKASHQTGICPKIIKIIFLLRRMTSLKQSTRSVMYLFFILVNSYNNWLLLGIAGGFVFGIGLFNFVAKILNQYLGHWVSILCFFTGGIMMLLSFVLCGGSI